MLSAALLASFLVGGEASERPLPRTALVDFTGTEARALDDYLGQVVLLDFFAHWCAPCARLVPHLNQLAQDFGERGLHVLGVTGDDEATASEWLTRLGARYPHARDAELGLQIELGFRPLPFAVLVDPCGVVVWQGNPADVPVERLEALLEGALARPAYRWPAAAAGVREALRDARYAEGERLAQACAEGGSELARFVGRIVTRRTELMEKALAAQDFLGAEGLALELEKGLAGGPQRARASTVRAEIARTVEGASVLAAQRQLQELWSGVRKVQRAQQAEELAQAIRALAATRPGTQVERSAKAYLETLAALKTVLP